MLKRIAAFAAIVMTTRSRIGIAATLTLALIGAALSADAIAQASLAADRKAEVIDHWTSERRAGAIPRDLVIDDRGLGYLRRADGALVPHGHDIQAMATGARPQAAQSNAAGASDNTPPAISAMDPGAGATIGASYTFKATVTDASGVKTVTFRLQKGAGVVQSFAAGRAPGTDVWSVALQGFTDGNDWRWWVEARDTARGGNLATSGKLAFSVDTGGGSGGGGAENNAEWLKGGVVQTAAGRLYFEMPANSRRKTWVGYVCSGTVVTDGIVGRSVILTAAHCVYDDANKAFARNVMFIPDQADTTGSGTDRNCSNDPLGCWVPSIGVVDVNWTTRQFPANIEWDYAFYVVKDSGMHQGAAASSEMLDAAAGSMAISFAAPSVNDAGPSDFTHALGYSYDNDPQLMYCAEDMTTEGAVNWWLPNCGLSGGSSGGPWVQPMDLSPADGGFGNGPIISVNSWGYTNQPGMAGPKLSGTSASCIFARAKDTTALVGTWADGEAGVKVNPSTGCP